MLVHKGDCIYKIELFLLIEIVETVRLPFTFYKSPLSILSSKIYYFIYVYKTFQLSMLINMF